MGAMVGTLSVPYITKRERHHPENVTERSLGRSRNDWPWETHGLSRRRTVRFDHLVPSQQDPPKATAVVTSSQPEEVGTTAEFLS